MDNPFLGYALTALGCYLFGSINLAVLVSKLFLHRDVRTCGSGNAGATNMLRTFGWKAAIPVFLGEFLKGFAAVWAGRAIAGVFGGDALLGSYLGGIFVLLGQQYPVYFGFHGGKGVAVSLGALVALHPIGGPIVLLCGLAVAALSGYVSAASVLGAIAYPILVFFLGGVRELIPALVMAALVLWGHRENIRRLLRHEENKFTPPPKAEKKGR